MYVYIYIYNIFGSEKGKNAAIFTSRIFPKISDLQNLQNNEMDMENPYCF